MAKFLQWSVEPFLSSISHDEKIVSGVILTSVSKESLEQYKVDESILNFAKSKKKNLINNFCKNFLELF